MTFPLAIGWQAVIRPVQIAEPSRGETVYEQFAEWRYDALGVEGNRVLVFDPDDGLVKTANEVAHNLVRQHEKPDGGERQFLSAYRFTVHMEATRR